MKHLVTLSSIEVKNILEGGKYLIRFFKKKPEFFNKIEVRDFVFFRLKKGEVLGQFEVKKVIKIEGLNTDDRKMVEDLGGSFNEESGSYLMIIGISSLEQLIASPIEIEKGSRKEWIVLDY